MIHINKSEHPFYLYCTALVNTASRNIFQEKHFVRICFVGTKERREILNFCCAFWIIWQLQTRYWPTTALMNVGQFAHDGQVPALPGSE